jgi:hypothetical protein
MAAVATPRLSRGERISRTVANHSSVHHGNSW